MKCLAKEPTERFRTAGELHAALRSLDPAPPRAIEDAAEAEGRKPKRRPRSSDAPTIAGFEVVEEVGAGAQGSVYRARDLTLDRVVALKVVRPRRSDDLERFLHEARALAKVDHPNVVRIHSAGESTDGGYLCMELLNGRTLDKVLEQDAKPSVDEALGRLRQLAEGLQAIHDAGVLHCDIKPSNLVLEPDGTIKLMDFGVSRYGRASSEGSADGGSSEGTPTYMSPEQIRDEDVDARSDLFSLGIVFYEMLAKAHPFQADSPMEVAGRILRERPVAIDEVRGDLDRNVRDLVETLLHKAPEERYASASEVVAAIDAIRATPVPTPSVETPSAEAETADAPRGPSRRGILAAVAVLVLAVGSFAAYKGLFPPIEEFDFRVRFCLVNPAGDCVQTILPGDRIENHSALRMEYQASRSTHVFVWVESEQDPPTLLFPFDESQLKNPVQAVERHSLPGRTESRPLVWHLDDKAGTLTFHVVTSANPSRAMVETFEKMRRPEYEVEASQDTRYAYEEIARVTRGISKGKSKLRGAPKTVQMATGVSTWEDEKTTEGGEATWEITFEQVEP